VHFVYFVLIFFSVRGGKGFRLLQLHFFVAADEHSFARLGAKHLGATNFTFVSFSKLAHSAPLLIRNSRFEIEDWRCSFNLESRISKLELFTIFSVP
jgi:hypothetical protein